MNTPNTPDLISAGALFACEPSAAADEINRIHRERMAEVIAERDRLRAEVPHLQMKLDASCNAEGLLASEKSTRNTLIAKGIEIERQLAEAREAFAVATDQLVQVQGELRQAREEIARLRDTLEECWRPLRASGNSQLCERIDQLLPT